MLTLRHRLKSQHDECAIVPLPAGQVLWPHLLHTTDLHYIWTTTQGRGHKLRLHMSMPTHVVYRTSVSTHTSLTSVLSTHGEKKIITTKIAGSSLTLRACTPASSEQTPSQTGLYVHTLLIQISYKPAQIQRKEKKQVLPLDESVSKIWKSMWSPRCHQNFATNGHWYQSGENKYCFKIHTILKPFKVLRLENIFNK